MSRVGASEVTAWFLTSIFLLTAYAFPAIFASEFPERECCDPVYPIPEPTSRAPSAPTPTGRSGTNIKTAVAILNCLFARQLCFEDSSCSAILEIIPRVCGPELVACSTVTVPKCQAALKTLQAFPFFKPTCLCREPHVDPECNSFRDFLFDHPCVYVLKKDPLPVEPLPTCNHALSVCQRGKTCVKLFEDFKTNCKARDGKCRMESRDACHEAWTQLRLSPMFGCICPNNHMKRRCDRIFSMVNHNPCVEFLPSATVDLSGTDSALYPFDSHQENFQEFWFPPTSMYPYFLFPATATTRTLNEIEARYRYHESSPPEVQSPEVPRPRGHADDGQDDLRPRRPLPVPGTIPHHHDHHHHHHDHSTRDRDRNDLDPSGLDLDPVPYPLPNPYPESDPRPDVTRDRDTGGSLFSEHEYAYVTATNAIVIDTKQHPPRPRNEHGRIVDGRRVHRPAGNNDDDDDDDDDDEDVDRVDGQQNPRENHTSRDPHRVAPVPIPRTPYPTVGIRPGSHPQSVSSQTHRHDQHDHHQHRHRHPPSLPAPDSHAPLPSPSMAPGRRDHDHHQHQHQHQHHDGKKFAPRPTYEHRSVVDDMVDLDDNELRLGGRQPIDRLFGLSEAFEGFVDKVKVISYPDNSTSFELIESQLENPLIDADHHDLEVLKQIPPIIPGIPRRKTHHGKNHTILEDNSTGKAAIIPSPISEADVHRIYHKPSIALTLSSTCHRAFESCRNDADCNSLMQPVLTHCDLVSCSKNVCMEALQQFYRNSTEVHSMEIAFCLCRKTEDKRDECIVAQEKMHPVCAQRVEGAEMPTCHSLAEVCREDKACRARLEYYEQSCAVDSVTKKCAGAPNECRKAMIGILGTELRSNCACKGTDLTQLYDCVGWQRLLWVNPCVVESQKDFHARKSRHRQKIILIHNPENPSTATTVGIDDDTLDSGQRDDLDSKSDVTGESGTVDEATPPPAPPRPWETSTAVSTTVSSTTQTTTIAASSTIPPRFCVVQRPRQTLQYIREGRGKRLYREDEPECSELCQCGEGQVLICNTICVETSPCKTDFAFYNHAAPAYQAYRGRCLCYSGRFICMRPFPDSYSIPHGVFMFLGYSETDENLLKPHSNLTVLDAVSSLDNFMRQEVDNQTICTLLLYNLTKENVIAVARLRPENVLAAGNASRRAPTQQNTQTLQQLTRVKDECGQMLRDLSEKINNRHHELHTHPLLSIFKMAEVEIKLPRASGSGTSVVHDTTTLHRVLITLLALANLALSWRMTIVAPALLFGGTAATTLCRDRNPSRRGIS